MIDFYLGVMSIWLHWTYLYPEDVLACCPESAFIDHIHVRSVASQDDIDFLTERKINFCNFLKCQEAHKLLQPADKTLREMALEFAEYQVILCFL